MIRGAFDIETIHCTAAGSDLPRVLLLQPIDMRDAEDRTAALLSTQTDVPFLHVAFAVENWNRELSPWEAPPVFGKERFGDGARRTLTMLETVLLPGLSERFSLDPDIPVMLGGYSLAALFALWCAYETDRFSAAVCASPSVWLPGWMDYAKTHVPKAGRIYLSLGDREEHAKNRVLQTVGDCIRAQAALLPPDRSVLEWNAGNHFQDPDLRVAKGFLWCLSKS